MSIQFSIAGTSPIGAKRNRKIVNFNLSHIVKSHFDYAKKLPEILSAVGVKTSPRSETSSSDLKAYCEKQDETASSPENLTDSNVDSISNNLNATKMDDEPVVNDDDDISLDSSNKKSIQKE